MLYWFESYSSSRWLNTWTDFVGELRQFRQRGLIELSFPRVDQHPQSLSRRPRIVRGDGIYRRHDSAAGLFRQRLRRQPLPRACRPSHCVGRRDRIWWNETGDESRGNETRERHFAVAAK